MGVLPRRIPLGVSWTEVQKYKQWCYTNRLAATGQRKRKWRHVERVLAQIYASLSPVKPLNALVEDAVSEQASPLVVCDERTESEPELLDWFVDSQGSGYT